jgi:LEA14-like dessication related protein
MTRMLRAGTLLMLFMAASACAWFQPFEEPRVRLNAMELQPGGGLQQVIHLTLRVDNPNDYALRLAGLNYRFFLEDQELISGELTERLAVPARGSADVVVPVELNLLSGYNLINQLLRSPRDEFRYRVDVAGQLTNIGLGRFRTSHEDSIRLHQ